MTKIKQSLLFIFTVIALVSCNFISNSLTYKDTTESFVESLMDEKFENSLNYMALEHEGFKNTNIDTLESGIKKFRDLIIRNFGEDLDYKFMTANKTYSTVEGKSTAPNTTKAQIQFSNKNEFGVFEIIFDDKSNKIIHIKTLDIKEPIPNMLLFWLFGVLAICIPIFNIWIIIKIKNSYLKKKWVKYIAVLFFNVPAITYSALSGLSFSFLSFQILFGIGFSYAGYLSSAWTFGIPLGGLYWLWKLKKKSNDEIITENEIITE